MITLLDEICGSRAAGISREPASLRLLNASLGRPLSSADATALACQSNGAGQKVLEQPLHCGLGQRTPGRVTANARSTFRPSQSSVASMFPLAINLFRSSRVSLVFGL
jgi:hypothetical protein